MNAVYVFIDILSLESFSLSSLNWSLNTVAYVSAASKQRSVPQAQFISFSLFGAIVHSI